MTRRVPLVAQILVVQVLLLVLLAACGGGGGGSARDKPASYGDGVILPSTSVEAPPTTVAPGAAAVGITLPPVHGGPVPVQAPSAATDVCTGPNRAGPRNVTVRDDPSGFRIELVVADHLCFAATDDITFQVSIQNVSSHPLHYDPNQLQFFVINHHNGPLAWDDTRCSHYGQAPDQVKGGALTLRPGDAEILKQSVYPGPTNEPSRETCRTLHGLFDVYGQVAWCPSVSGGLCSRDQYVQSSPVEIRIS